MFSSTPRATPARNLCLTLVVVCSVFLSSSFAQQPFLTSRADISRSGANTNETLLTPANVSKNSFGRLFSFPVDYVVMAQPLYMPNVNIPGQGTHNVIYIVTQADSVYAIDADNGAQLWYASMLNGGTTASGIYLPCGTGPGYNQEGIVSTPVIDPTTNTMYLVAKTLLNTTVRHHLHALDITTGYERASSPVLITATSTSNAGHLTVFNSKHQKNRPGLLLLNGVLYLGFGSNSCNDANSGWVLSYDATSLSQLAVFNASPVSSPFHFLMSATRSFEAGWILPHTCSSFAASGLSFSASTCRAATTDISARGIVPFSMASSRTAANAGREASVCTASAFSDAVKLG